MVLNRDNLLKELRSYVIDVFLTNGQSHKCTLQHKFLPKKFINEEQQQEIDYHAGNPKMIAAWNVQYSQWICFSIDEISYTQIVDM